MQTTSYYDDAIAQHAVDEAVQAERQDAADARWCARGDARDAAIAIAATTIWRELRTGAKARSAMPKGMGPGPLLETTVARDLAECEGFDTDAVERMIVNAASAEQNDELYAFYLQAIALDVVAQVRKMVAKAAVTREIDEAVDAEFVS